MESDDMYLPNPFHISFGSRDDFVRGNIFRPVQPYKTIIPHIEMIMPPIIWIGYAIYLIREKKVPKQGDCLFLDPDHGEFTQAVLWKVYGNSDYVIGRDWACTRNREWFFNSETSGRQRRWPDDIASLVKSIHSSSEIDEATIKTDFELILGSGFIRAVREYTDIQIEEAISEILFPKITKISSEIDSDEKKEYLTKTIIDFIRYLFIETRSGINERYKGEEIPNSFDKFFQSNIVDQEYSMIGFLKEVLEIDSNNPESIMDLEQLGDVVYRLSSPYFKPEEIDCFLAKLSTTNIGRTLLISFVLIDYASKIISEKEHITSQFKATEKLLDDELLIFCLEKIIDQKESGFKSYLQETENIPLEFMDTTLTYEEIEKIIYYWFLNFFIYYGEVVIRNDIEREKIIDQGFSERDIEKLLTIQDFEQRFLCKFLANYYPKTIHYLEIFKSENKIERANYIHLQNFIQILKNGLVQQNKEHVIFYQLLKTDKSLELTHDKLIAVQDSRQRFNKLSHSVVFPGRDNIVRWHNELVEMRLKGYG